MSNFNQQQAPAVSYPGADQASYVSAPAPPPMGYPSMDAPSGAYPQQSVPQQTSSRGDGFWEGCCAALCCCCALDCCF